MLYHSVLMHRLIDKQACTSFECLDRLLVNGGKWRMARVTVEDCLENVNSRFALVQLTVRRVLQLRRGAFPLINAPKNKEVVVALREIAAKKVTVDSIRQFEELDIPSLPASSSSLEESAAIHKELEEILESETQLGIDSEMEIKDDESLNETVEDED
jgi:DNA-directed RNA polymerase subunit omega